MGGDFRASLGLLRSSGGFSVDTSLLVEGDLALLADSMNQCLMEANWLMNGCLEERRPGRCWNMPLGGARSSRLEATNWRVLPLDLLRSLGGGGGRCRDEFAERTGSFSIGGGGVADCGESMTAPSGSFGSSGRTSCADFKLARPRLLVRKTYELPSFAGPFVLVRSHPWPAARVYPHPPLAKVQRYARVDCLPH